MNKNLIEEAKFLIDQLVCLAIYDYPSLYYRSKRWLELVEKDEKVSIWKKPIDELIKEK